MSVIVAIGGYKNSGLVAIARAPFAAAVLVGICAAIHYARTPCPGCLRRWAGTAWDHQRKDGGPDMRYNHNALRCLGCGHVKGHSK